MVSRKQVPLSEAYWFQEGPGVRNWQFTTSGVKLLNVGNITKDGNIDLDKTDKHISLDEAEGKYSHFLVDEGDLVIASSGISFDEDGMLRTRGAFIEKKHLPLCLNTSTIRFKAMEGVSDLNFFKFWLDSFEFRDQVSRLVTGSAQQNFGPSHLKIINISLPPLAEQKRIASLLARADRLRQMQQTAHDLGDALLQSVFLEMFGDIAHSKWDKSELGELIEDFEAGVNYLPGGEGEKVSEWRVLKISAVTWGDFDPTESKAIREYDEFDEKHIVRQGDLLISRANTTELVGAVSLVKIIPPKVLLPDKLWRVKFKEDSAILPEYTLHLLRQPELRKIIGDLATGSSGSMKNISMEKAYTLPIPVPPLSLQEEFAGVVARVESLRGRMGESERQASGLFESLLAQSFDGGR